METAPAHYGRIRPQADYAQSLELLRRGSEATIITYGALTPTVMEAWSLLVRDGKSVAVLNMASLVPLDKDAVLEAAGNGPVVTVEDHHVDTGLGAMVALVLAEAGKAVPFKRCGVKFYGGSGQPAELYARQGLDAGSIAAVVQGLL